MEPLKITSKSQFDTMKIAKTLASFLHNGDVIVLSGELGAGKTKFTEGFLQHFNLSDEICSPTFNIVNEYISNEQTNIYHFDVYRLEDSSEFYAIGGEEYFSKGICIIEWGEIIQDILPNNYIEIIFEKDACDIDKRYINFKAHGNKYISLLNNFKETLII